MTGGDVAVVVPMSFQARLTADEEISLRHLLHFLGPYDRYFVCPASAPFRRAGFDVVTFPDRFFGSAKAHARLQLSEAFYERFSRYKYVLTYHLDSLVLSDRLLEWCDAGYDFIGAPWLPCADSPWVTQPRVGNSGFSLMNIEGVLKVLRSPLPAVDPDVYWEAFCRGSSRGKQWLNLPRRYLLRVGAFNNVRSLLRRWPEHSNGDLFWADHAVTYSAAFTVAPFDAGLAFAFEVAPRQCFAMNACRLPFGCHAWAKYDRAFWEPHLLE